MISPVTPPSAAISSWYERRKGFVRGCAFDAVDLEVGVVIFLASTMAGDAYEQLRL
jgi:hypothetical protein